MEYVECVIKKSLNGEAIDEFEELCDFTIENQMEAETAKGLLQNYASLNFTPQLKKNITYIVALVLINDSNEILMIQEAKSNCAGQWYLPAGQIEPNESIIEASKREVLQETGLHLNPTTLLLVQGSTNSWFRFVLTGLITGGKLKTPSDADAKSLQAKWVKNLKELVLRCNDILPLIDRALIYKNESSKWHPQLLPSVEFSHKKLLIRCIVCIRNQSNSQLYVLISEKNKQHLPLCELRPLHNFHSTLKHFMIEIFGATLPPHRLHGIMAIEHNGKNNQDGFCFTILMSVREPLEKVNLISKHNWIEISPSLSQELLKRFTKNMTVPYQNI